jgi:hypothetical protein
MINWNTSKQDALTISEIVARARGYWPDVNALKLNMDITATHANGCPLKLRELAGAPKLDFAHDVCGIQRHINRETGQLENCFVPRYAAPIRAEQGYTLIPVLAILTIFVTAAVLVAQSGLLHAVLARLAEVR